MMVRTNLRASYQQLTNSTYSEVQYGLLAPYPGFLSQILSHSFGKKSEWKLHARQCHRDITLWHHWFPCSHADNKCRWWAPAFYDVIAFEPSRCEFQHHGGNGRSGCKITCLLYPWVEVQTNVIGQWGGIPNNPLHVCIVGATCLLLVCSCTKYPSK